MQTFLYMLGSQVKAISSEKLQSDTRKEFVFDGEHQSIVFSGGKFFSN